MFNDSYLFLKAVMVNVVAYYICKWLDSLFSVLSN